MRRELLLLSLLLFLLRPGSACCPCGCSSTMKVSPSFVLSTLQIENAKRTEDDPSSFHNRPMPGVKREFRDARLIFENCSSILDVDRFSFSLLQRVQRQMEAHFWRENSTELSCWNQSLPLETEVVEMKQASRVSSLSLQLLHFLYNSDNFERDCQQAILRNITPHISAYLDVTLFKADSFKSVYCVVHERFPVEGCFIRGWGYAILRQRGSATGGTHEIHHSASHFESDGDVTGQAAWLFESTSGRSLVVAGASRFAVIGDNRSPCQPENQVADVSHDTRNMFHTMCVGLFDAVKTDPRHPEYAFIQWHGMAETSCLSSPAFVSAGATNHSLVYDNVAAPANLIVASFTFLGQFSGLWAKTPREDTDCKLTATTNVFGRYVNGVDEVELCHRNADDASRFIHIEQKENARNAWKIWSDALALAFSGTKPFRGRDPHG